MIHMIIGMELNIEIEYDWMMHVFVEGMLWSYGYNVKFLYDWVAIYEVYN